MKIQMLVLALAAGMSAGAVFAQGSLTPPGAPAPTMKTLTQVEPRTPITELPFAITESGAYYLTTNLVCTNGNGVTISADAVTLDLMGFAIGGTGASLTAKGIRVFGGVGVGLRDVVVRNGTVGRFGTGLQIVRCQNGRFEHLAVLDNRDGGISLTGTNGVCNGNTIAHCAIADNAGNGLSLEGSSGQCNGNLIFDCVVQSNSNQGICLAGPSGQCNGNLIRDCALFRNGVDGLRLDGMGGWCEGNVVRACVVQGNGENGISTWSAGGACNGNLLSGCTVSGNGSDGIKLSGFAGACEGNVVVDCEVGENGESEIFLESAVANRVEGNRVNDFSAGATNGIRGLTSTNNLIVRNSGGGQTDDFYLSAHDVYGPIVDIQGELATSGAGAHPWANFSQ